MDKGSWKAKRKLFLHFANETWSPSVVSCHQGSGAAQSAWIICSVSHEQNPELPLWSLSPQTSTAPSIMYQRPLPFGKHLTKFTGPNIMATTPFMLTQTQKLFSWIQQKNPKFYIRSLFRFQGFLKHTLNLQNAFDLPVGRKSAATMHFLLQISHTQ